LRRPFLNARSLAIIDSFGDEIMKALQDLRPGEQVVITLRYGLSRQEPRTYKELADMFHLSIARVQNFERSGISTLRHLSDRRTEHAGSARE